MTEIDQTGASRLYAIARGLTAALTALDVAEAVFSGLAGPDASSVGLWLLQSGRLRFVGGFGLPEDLPSGIADMDLDAPLPGAEALRRRQIVTYGSEGERDERWPRLAGLETATRATAVLPLFAGDRPLGCLHVGYGEAKAPGEFDLEFLAGLAELCAAALDRAQLHDAGRARQELLLAASSAVANATTFRDSLQRLAAVAVPSLADLCLIDAWAESGRIERMAAVHRDPVVAELVAELGARYAPEARSAHPASVAMEQRRSVWAAEMPDDFLRATTRDDRHYELTRRLGFTSFISVPLIVGGEALGAITLVSAGSGRRYGPPDLLLAEDLAAQIADVVAAARRHDREHQLAHVLQTLLLPDGLPRIPGVASTARYLTARRDAEAGGDFYDLLRLPSGRVGFMIGDVEGHDPTAAAIMGQLRSAIRALAGQHREPHLLVDALRWSWDLLGFTRLATCLIGRLDPIHGQLVLCSAGHLPPVVIDPGGDARTVDVSGSPPLGAPAGAAREQHLLLAPGSTLFLYTDGLVERPDRGLDEGIDDLLVVLRGTDHLSVDEICDRVLGRLPGRGQLIDDVAVLALRLEGGGNLACRPAIGEDARPQPSEQRRTSGCS